jgi:hypothetical protein
MAIVSRVEDDLRVNTLEVLKTLSAPLIAQVDLTGQNAAISSTNFANTGSGLVAGEYVVYGYLDITAAATSGNISVTINYTDESGANSQTTSSVGVGTLHNNGGFALVLYATANATISYTVNFTSVVGTPTYAVHLWLAQVPTATAGSSGGGGSVTLETNGTNNTSQTVLNLKSAPTVTVTNPSGGDVTIATAYVPDISNFTWVNQGTATATQTISPGPILMQINDNAALNWRGLFATQPATPYKVKAQWKMYITSFTNSQTSGIYFYDGTKLMGMEFLTQSGLGELRVEKINSVTSDNSTAFVTGNQYSTFMIGPLYTPFWSQLRNSGSNIYFDYSWDGTNFVNVFSEAIGTFITPTKIGFGGVSVTGTGSNYVINDLFNWQTYSNATL